jgi:cytochrome c
MKGGVYRMLTLEKLLRENMPNGKETSKQSLEQIGIDWNKYM